MIAFSNGYGQYHSRASTLITPLTPCWLPTAMNNS